MSIKNTLIVVLIYLSCISSASSQENEIAESKFAIKTSPLNLIDFNNGKMATLGAEIKLFKGFSLYSEYGRHFGGIGSIQNQSGFTIREEIKHYLNKDGKAIYDYVSLEFSHANLAYDRTDIIDTTQFDGPNYEKTYSLTRRFSGVVIQYGTLMIHKKGWTLDVYVGLGVRFNEVHCDLNDFEADHRVLGDWTVASNYTQKCGKDIILRCNAGVKVGYRIW